MLELHSQYASITRRFGALFLDILILIIPAAVLGGLIPAAGSLIAWFLYAPFFESSMLKATIGKKLMGIQVVDIHGGRISFRAAMLRALTKLISTALSFIPYLTVFFTEKKQAAHDLVAETVVVYGRAEVPAVDAWIDMMREVFRGGESGVAPTSSDARLSALERLQSLFERGALTKEEFEREKAKLL